MRDELVAGKYALALFNVALKRDELDAVFEDLHALEGLGPIYRRLHRTMTSPTVTTDFKRDLLARALKGRVTTTTFSTLNLLLEKKRFDHLARIITEFGAHLRRHRGIVHAVAWTAQPLEATQAERLKKELGRISGKKIELESRVDTKILGGVVVNLEEKILDGSVRRGLDDLRETLMKVRVL